MTESVSKKVLLFISKLAFGALKLRNLTSYFIA